LLVVNNLRDIPSDARAGKRTVAVRIGAQRTRLLYAGLLVVAYVLVLVAASWRPWVLLALASVPLALGPITSIRSGASGPALIPVLGATGRLQLAFGALATLGVVLSA
jgi:1,4-dihydroxy-2-naphthoate octaprenyltransferase